ncbi:dihydrofolate reductase [Aquisalimonas asiatica]|uniref:Dihydrofolate reductase n=1 Tax=Aquisalimonas asiatica TaxID=406100 RepID=A0A1H8TRR7_9GAMM|nr:dihydrofolate reductase [Aquisalimonas asiatica]SEO93314.1 dihydrofolate reductase [Aquisalimonas asiatica]
MISLIAALTPDHVIGKGNDLPWRIPDDLRHFKRTTRGKPVIMGRRNYLSIGRPLPDRHNIVMTRNPDFQAPGCTVVADADAALTAAGDAREVMIIGGAEIYRLFLPRADRLYLTWVHTAIDGDTWFPAFDAHDWQVIDERHQAPDDNTPFPLHFQTLARR